MVFFIRDENESMYKTCMSFALCLGPPIVQYLVLYAFFFFDWLSITGSSVIFVAATISRFDLVRFLVSKEMHDFSIYCLHSSLPLFFFIVYFILVFGADPIAGTFRVKIECLENESIQGGQGKPRKTKREWTNTGNLFFCCCCTQKSAQEMTILIEKGPWNIERLHTNCEILVASRVNQR